MTVLEGGKDMLRRYNEQLFDGEGYGFEIQVLYKRIVHLCQGLISEDRP